MPADCQPLNCSSTLTDHTVQPTTNGNPRPGRAHYTLYTVHATCWIVPQTNASKAEAFLMLLYSLQAACMRERCGLGAELASSRGACIAEGRGRRDGATQCVSTLKGLA
jgi:hypothetical protein